MLVKLSALTDLKIPQTIEDLLGYTQGKGLSP